MRIHVFSLTQLSALAPGVHRSQCHLNVHHYLRSVATTFTTFRHCIAERFVSWKASSDPSASSVIFARSVVLIAQQSPQKQQDGRTV